MGRPRRRGLDVLEELGRAWPDLADTWQSAAGALEDEGGGDEALLAFLEGACEAHGRLCKGWTADWAPIRDWLVPRLKRLKCPEPRGLCRILEKEVFYHHTYGIPILGDIVTLCLLPEDQLASEDFARFVSWGLGAPYVDLHAPANKLADWSRARIPASELLARLKEQEPKEAVFTARVLWIRARQGEDLTEHLPAVREGLDNPIPNVAFFLSCALRHHVWRYQPKSPLPPVRPPGKRPAPDVRHRSPWNHFSSTVSTSRTPQHKKLWTQGHRKTHTPHEGEDPCAVCSGEDTTCIYHEEERYNSGHWELHELRCAECGSCTLYHLDD